MITQLNANGAKVVILFHFQNKKELKLLPKNRTSHDGQLIKKESNAIYENKRKRRFYNTSV